MVPASEGLASVSHTQILRLTFLGFRLKLRRLIKGLINIIGIDWSRLEPIVALKFAYAKGASGL
jgi:hypothetical protein